MSNYFQSAKSYFSPCAHSDVTNLPNKPHLLLFGHLLCAVFQTSLAFFSVVSSLFLPFKMENRLQNTAGCAERTSLLKRCRPFKVASIYHLFTKWHTNCAALQLSHHQYLTCVWSGDGNTNVLARSRVQREDKGVQSPSCMNYLYFRLFVLEWRAAVLSHSTANNVAGLLMRPTKSALCV